MSEENLLFGEEWHAKEWDVWRSGEAVAAALPNRDQIVDALQPWCRAWLATTEPRDASRVGAAELPAEVDPEIANALRESTAGHGIAADTPQRAAAWSLMMDAMARALIAAAPRRDVIRAFYGVPGWPQSAYRVFTRRLRVAAVENKPQAQAWIAFLADVPADLAADLQHETGQAYIEAAAAWSKVDDAFAIFDAGYRRGMDWNPITDWHRTRMSFLLELSPDDWARTVDSLPLPHMMWDAVDTGRVSADPDLIQHLLANGPRVFDADGKWTRSVVVLLVSDLVDDYIRSVHQNVWRAAQDWGAQGPEIVAWRERGKQRLTQLEGGELRGKAEALYSTLIARPDGKPLAFEVFARMTRVMIIGEFGHRAGQWSANGAAIKAMTSALLKAGVQTDALRAWWKSREDDERQHRVARGEQFDTSSAAPTLLTEGLPYLVGAIAMLETMKADGGTVEAATRLWEWATQLLVGRDPGVDLIHVGRADSGLQFLGYLLARQPVPRDAWKKLYGSLESQRRRAAMVANEVPSPRGSIDLGWTGLFACLCWGQRGGTFDDIAALHADVLTASRYLYLTASGIDVRGKTPLRLLVGCFAVATAVWKEHFADVAVEMLTPLANDPVAMRDVFAALTANKVPPETIAAIAARLGIGVDETSADANRISPPHD